jgi:hypothetical protein
VFHQFTRPIASTFTSMFIRWADSGSSEGLRISSAQLSLLYCLYRLVSAFLDRCLSIFIGCTVCVSASYACCLYSTNYKDPAYSHPYHSLVNRFRRSVIDIIMFSSSRTRHQGESFSKHRASKSKSHKKAPSFKDAPRRIEKLVQQVEAQSPQSNQTSPTLGR